MVNAANDGLLDREELERRAKTCCPTELWYDLSDTLDETPDADLRTLIDEHEGSTPGEGLGALNLSDLPLDTTNTKTKGPSR
ncbi:hypothetical protein [Marinimicrobium sp. ABcell2]|uniref:hypothetical protein n=1 Tax=Marinimicrobium sp. ABcell2 TaxID=3069751 RepID=UPI0027B5139C|nr:hypothetical protein [Marinimicrobium sp. ABcell2]MDQ2077467.1 hypothetical protein [Marinimicrobium sp. ABcell2]